VFEELFGISKSILFPNHWETSLITSRTSANDLITNKNLEYILSLLNNPVEHDDLLIIKNKVYCQRSAYISNGLCVMEKIRHLIKQEGSAVYVRWLEKYDYNFNTRAHLLNQEMAPFKFNFCLFYSPLSTAIFDEHFDAHDAFIIQLEGSKKWQIWPAIVSDVESISTPRVYKSQVIEYVKEHPPSHEITLKPGDVMYLPRCTIHKTSATGEHSSHLNVWMTPRRLENFVWEF